MAFALTVLEIKASLERGGCPICDQRPRALERYLEAFHAEHVNDYDSRMALVASLGFCPPHTFQMVTMEMRAEGDPLGTNLIYEHLSKFTRHSLEGWRAGQRGSILGRWWRRGRNWLRRRPLDALLPVERPCLACVAVAAHEERILAALIEELQRGAQDIVALYRQGDGLCLAHLRRAAALFNGDYPAAVDFLVQDCCQRLAQHEVHLGEYIRKHNWAYRDEALTPEEEDAWRHSLSFYTGYPPEAFQPFAPLPGTADALYHSPDAAGRGQ